MKLSTEVLVLGGGATGLGAAWDAALRGFKTVLLEKGDLAHGTSGPTSSNPTRDSRSSTSGVSPRCTPTRSHGKRRGPIR